MTTFALTGSYHPEEVAGKQYISVYCLVKGDVRFSRLSSGARQGLKPREDESGKQLLQQIRNLSTLYCLTNKESIDADIVIDNVIVVRFLLDELYNREIVTKLYDIIHHFCLIEVALSTTRARETFGGLYKQTTSLLRELKLEKEEGDDSIRIQYLVTSIRYGTLDVFGGVLLPNPKSYRRKVLLDWIMPVAKRILEERDLPQ